MITATLGSMTVEHFDGATGKSVLFSQVSIIDFARVLFSVLEVNLEKEFDQYVCTSPVQTCVAS